MSNFNLVMMVCFILLAALVLYTGNPFAVLAYLGISIVCFIVAILVILLFD